MRQRWHYLGCEHKRRSSSTPRAVRWAIAHGVCRCSMSHSDRISHGGGMVVVVTIGRDRVLWQPVCIPSLIPMSCSSSCTCCSFCSFCSFCSWYHLPLSTAGVPHHPTQRERTHSSKACLMQGELLLWGADEAHKRSSSSPRSFDRLLPVATISECLSLDDGIR
jgi:hypothetical protein